MKHNHYLSIRKFLLILLFFIISLSIIGINYISHMKKQLADETLLMLQEITNQGTQTIDLKIQEEFTFLESFIKVFVQDSNLSYEKFLGQFSLLEEKKDFKITGTADLNGNLILSTGIIQNINDKEYFQRAVSGEKTISYSTDSLIDDEPTIVYALPILHENVVTGVLVASYPVESFFNKMMIEFFDGEGRLFILDEVGTIKYCSASSSNTYNLIESHDEWHTRHGQSTSSIENRICEDYLKDLAGSFYTISPIKSHSGWSLLYAVPEEIIARNSSHILRTTTYMALWIITLFTIIITYILLSSELTKRKIYKLAYISDETGLYNKNKFIEVAHCYLSKRKSPQTILYFDIDNFKVYNEIFGQDFNMKLVQEITNELRTLFKNKGIVYGHLGHDHFVALLPYSDENDILQVVHTLEQSLEKIQLEEYPFIHIILSMGIYTLPADSTDISDAINKASLAKEKVKGHLDMRHTFFNEEDSKVLKEHGQLEADILTALDHEQFCIYYQPKVHSNTQQTSGAEALIRWIHPSLGMISPNKFIPLAEANGSILEITKYVIRQVCLDITEWVDQNKPLVPISINFSQIEIYNPSIFHYLKHCLKKYNIDPKWLEIEITERVALEDLKRVKNCILSFQKLGIKVSMDDFGSGYSSTNYIKYLPFDIIKIDKTLIDDIETDQKSHQLLLGLVNIIKSLGLSVVAEGVENPKQVEYIRQMGVDYIQGYVFSKPLPKSEFEKFLSQ